MGKYAKYYADTLLDRLAEKVLVGDGCWEWIGGKADTGYGKFHIPGATAPKQVQAHRLVYELLHGPIPDGLEADHLCENRGCVNPSHIELVPHRANVLRGKSPIALAHANGICIRGHTNIRRRPNGASTCRTCDAERQRRNRRRARRVA